MDRSLNDIVGQVVDKSNKPRGSSPEIYGRIRLVDYSTGHIVVKAKGFGTIRKVRVQRGIQLGTTDRPVVVVGDIATLRRKGNGRWICTAIEHKDRCASSSALVVEVEVDTSSSYISQQLSSLELPDDLRPPPLIPLANFTLPSLRFPDPTTYLCGIPQCTNCAPSGYVAGYVLKLSSDVDHPGGCWVWGPRPSVTGQIYYRATVTLNTPGAGEIIQDGISVIVKGNYAYVIDVPYQVLSVPVANSMLYTIDLSDISSPVIVDTQDVGYTFNRTGIGYHGNTLYITGNDNVAPAFNQLLTYDISSPGSPSQTNDVATTLDTMWAVYDDGGTPYLIGGEVGSSFIVIDGTTLAQVVVLNIGPLSYISPIFTNGLVVVGTDPFPGTPRLQGIDITNPASPSVLWDTTADAFTNGFLNSTEFYADGEALYDVTIPASPVVTGIPFAVVEGNHPTVIGNFMYIANTNGNARAIDISDPENPVLINIAAPDIPVGSGGIQGETVQYGSGSDDAGVLRYAFAGTNGTSVDDPDAGTYLTLFSNIAP